MEGIKGIVLKREREELEVAEIFKEKPGCSDLRKKQAGLRT